MTIVNIGANQYEIHGTLAGATAYFGGRLDVGAWTDAGATDRLRGLIMAAQWLDQLENANPSSWTGTRPDGQVLPWGRVGATCNGVAVPDGTIPGGIITGEYELALALLTDPTIIDARSQGSLVKSVKAEGTRVEFFGASLGTALDTALPPIVDRLVGCFLDGTEGAITPTVIPSEVGSQFRNPPTVNEGYA